MNDTMTIIITDKKTPKYWFQTILYDSIINSKNRVILSTIHKYKYIVDRFLLPLLKCHGWIIDEDVHIDKPFKPIEEEKQYDSSTSVIHLKYHLVRDVYNHEIIREILKEKKNQESFAFLLDRLDIDRREINEGEAIESIGRAFNFFLRKNIKQVKAFEKYVDSILKEKK